MNGKKTNLANLKREFSALEADVDTELSSVRIALGSGKKISEGTLNAMDRARTMIARLREVSNEISGVVATAEISPASADAKPNAAKAQTLELRDKLKAKLDTLGLCITGAMSLLAEYDHRTEFCGLRYSLDELEAVLEPVLNGEMISA